MSEPTFSATPGCCSIAFKEWERVCLALTSGRQSLILRKGGIAEGPGGFTPEHGIFWLYPTAVHQAQQGLKPEAQFGQSRLDEHSVPIDGLSIVGRVWRVDRKEALEGIEPLHVWTPATVAARFAYRKPGLWVLAVRMYQLAEPHRVEVTPAYAGCKTWVELDAPLSTAGVRPVLSDNAFHDQMNLISSALGTTGK